MNCPQCFTEMKRKCKACGYEKPKAVKIPKAPKEEPTESELVHKYVNRVIKNQVYHGRVDQEKFQGLEHTKSVSKNLWMDSDFFFSVVFQSSEQKYQFLNVLKERFGVEVDDGQIQIVNGLLFAKAMGLDLKKETSRDFPSGSLDLMPFILDDEDSSSEE